MISCGFTCAKLELLRKLEERRGEERRGVEEDERGVMGEAGSHTLSVQALVN